MPVKVFDSSSSATGYYRAELAIDSMGRFWIQAFFLQADGSSSSPVAVSSTPDLLLASADRALYRAKQQGRNRTESARRLRWDEPTLSFGLPLVVESGLVRDLIEDESSIDLGDEQPLSQ